VTAGLGALTRLRRIRERALEVVEADPIAAMCWFKLQYAFLACPDRVKQIRCGNQFVGKSTCALAEVVGRCLGRHPTGLEVPEPPIEAWVICASWSQSVAIQGKLRALIADRDLHPDCHYDPVKGFRGTSPVVRFANGSIIRIKTTGQGGLALAGATIDVALFDEPPADQRTYVEVSRRLAHRGGTLLLAYTPVNAPVDYLRELVAAGQITDHWAPMELAQLDQVDAQGRPTGVPYVGPDGQVRDQAWIDRQRAAVPDHEQPVVIDGEWEMRATDRFFAPFRASGARSHVHDRLPDADVDLVLGIDHGHRPGKQIAVLMLVWRTYTPPDAAGIRERRTHVYVLDEYCDTEGTATPVDDAKGILAMLGRHGYAWGDLSHAYGDRVHLPGSQDTKSNRDLSRALARQLGVRLEGPGALWPQIRTAKRGQGRGAGSAESRSRWLYHRMAEDGFGVHPRCQRVIEACLRYDLTDDEYKDPIDAVVYGLDQYIYGSGRAPDPTPVRTW
jgi:hypothetical protein